jgi:hypothetical protein
MSAKLYEGRQWHCLCDEVLKCPFVVAGFAWAQWINHNKMAIEHTFPNVHLL